jgi:preprotein translocase subunit SecF
MFNLLKYYKLFFGISIVTLIIGVSALGLYGLKPGIDFTGGTITELKFKEVPNIDKIQQVLNSSGIGAVLVQTTGERGVIVKTGELDNEKHKTVIEKLNTEVGGFEQTKFESIGPVIGKELRSDALWQLFLVSAGIIFYIAYAFRKVQKPITSWWFLLFSQKICKWRDSR